VSDLVVIGGTAGIGREVAVRAARRGGRVVISGRDADRARAVAAEIGGDTRGIAVDLSAPAVLGKQLADIEAVDHLVLSGISRDHNTIADYDVDAALALVTLKLVGYAEVIHQLRPRMADDAAIVVFGGLAKDRPYPGSTTVTAVNGAVTSMVRTFAIELAPVRVNALHPGIVGDSPMWKDAAEMLANVKARTPTGRLITMDEVTDAAVFLLENRAVNGVNLHVDGGWMML
jgi:NAD(P)-dependent dehydrogenase (short-subunit alcohol dehydrogenase family)